MATHAAMLLQAKLYDIVSGDSIIQSLVGARVYDHVPDNATYPFIVIDDADMGDWGAVDVDGFDVEFMIDTWSQAAGKKEAKTIQIRIYELLHNTNLGMLLHKTISLRQGMQTTMLDPDGRTHHGVNRFNLILGGS